MHNRHTPVVCYRGPTVRNRRIMLVWAVGWPQPSSLTSTIDWESSNLIIMGACQETTGRMCRANPRKRVRKRDGGESRGSTSKRDGPLGHVFSLQCIEYSARLWKRVGRGVCVAECFCLCHPRHLFAGEKWEDCVCCVGVTGQWQCTITPRNSGPLSRSRCPR